MVLTGGYQQGIDSSRSASGERIDVLEAGEAPEVVVGRIQGRAVFDGHRREVSVGRQIIPPWKRYSAADS